MQQGAATPIRRGSPVVGVASPITGYRRVPKSPPKSPLSSLITSPLRSAQTPRSPDRKSGAEQQLAVFFFQCDEYRTGQVKAQRLLGLLRELAQEEVEVAQVDHLARILDPLNDDRSLDLEQWLRAGCSWLASLARNEKNGEGAGRRQAGSLLEGVGGRPGCSSREVELEAKLEEVEFTVARLGKELEEALRAQMSSEEQAELLEAELNNKNELLCGLREQIGQMSSVKEEPKDQNEDLKKLGEDLESAKRKLDTHIERESDLECKLLGEQEKCKMLEEELLARETELKEERRGRREDAEQLEELKLEVELLREKEAVTVFATEKSPNVSMVQDESQSDKMVSMIHDMSLDDGLVESGKFLVRDSVSSLCSVSSLSLVEELVEVTGEEERLTCSQCDEKAVHVPEEAKQRLIKALHQVVAQERSEEVNSAVSAFLGEVEQGRCEVVEEAGAQNLECSDNWCRGNWLWICLLVFFGLASFTFSGLRLNHTEYYPATWHGLRWLIGKDMGLPRPITLLTYNGNGGEEECFM